MQNYHFYGHAFKMNRQQCQGGIAARESETGTGTICKSRDMNNDRFSLETTDCKLLLTGAGELQVPAGANGYFWQHTIIFSNHLQAQSRYGDES